MEETVPTRRLFGFLLASAGVAVFFDAFWLLGYRIAALDKLSEALGYFQFLLWFLAFLLVSLLSFQGVIKKRLLLKCSGIAVFFSIVLFWFLLISSALLAPILDPWY
jgi:hypothetical protein